MMIPVEIFKLFAYANLENMENKSFEEILKSSKIEKGLTLYIPRGEDIKNISIVEKYSDKYRFLFGKFDTRFINEIYICIEFHQRFY